MAAAIIDTFEDAPLHVNKDQEAEAYVNAAWADVKVEVIG